MSPYLSSMGYHSTRNSALVTTAVATDTEIKTEKYGNVPLSNCQSNGLQDSCSEINTVKSPDCQIEFTDSPCFQLEVGT